MFIEKFLNKELIVTTLIIIACIFLAIFFPVNGIYQRVISGIVFFIIVPILYVKFILKKEIKNYFNINFNKPKNKDNLLITLLVFIMTILLFLAINKYTSFSNHYFLKNSILIRSFLGFIAYEFLIVNIFIASYEFFFRGFIMSYFSKKLGIYSIYIQFIFFLMLLLITNNLSIAFIYYIIIALSAGVVAYKNRSIVYSYIFSLITIIIGDIIFLSLQK